MLNPVSTYRIQFNKEFTFRDFEIVIPYLRQLGIKTIYASPVFQAAPGSLHGYDTVNPHQINPEIGTLDELRAISQKLKTFNINWIQDIVPNHMSFHTDNHWLMDVLEKGAESQYAGFFDINWSHHDEQPLMVPFLDCSLDDAIRSGEMKLVTFKDQVKLKYKDSLWPVNNTVKSTDMPLTEALDAQYYRLCHYGETNNRINYRRFFTVNSLICLNMQHEEIFHVYHQLIKQLLEEDIFQGLRVDHIDGLYDPETYLSRLRAIAGPEAYIIVEKILEAGEEMGEWPVEGNTGYDFLAYVNHLFTDGKNAAYLTGFYNELTGDVTSLDKQIIIKKTDVLRNSMAGELDNLYHLFLQLGLSAKKKINRLAEETLKEAIAQLLIHCPVYRFYGNQLPLSGSDKKELTALLKEIATRPSLREAASILEKVLIKEPQKGNEDFNILATEFYLRCMQFSGPLMAKGVEDTLMYTYSRFIAHNEVGDSPQQFGLKKKVIHNWMWKRQIEWPMGLNATATHDTKRGEDVRARLNVLSELPEEWSTAVSEWKTDYAMLSEELDPGDVYFVYQTLAGTYPMPGTIDGNYEIRLQEYLEKSLREGKRSSNWEEPDTAYEKRLKDFALQLLSPAANFRERFIPLHHKISSFGIINSLVQLAMKFTCPGIPDLYQGTELWDLSMVDPDNRRAVDYSLRAEWLQEMIASGASLSALWPERFNGKIKLLLQHLLLKIREASLNIFTSGDYVPLKLKGKYAKHLFAFARKIKEEWMVIVLPLQLVKVTAGDEDKILNIDWEHTRLVLPSDAPSGWENLLTGNHGHSLELNEIFSGFPMGLLKMTSGNKKRSAGILMHITSLPSVYGIGDLGTEAREFIDFLVRSGQKYWQLLPLNPIHEQQAFSPYSSVSAIAGNTLLISPVLLLNDGLLTRAMLDQFKLLQEGIVDFKTVTREKDRLMAAAYSNFKIQNNVKLTAEFHTFCEQEASWLNDFSLFTVIKSAHGDLPWYQWPEEFATRKPAMMRKFAADHQDGLLFVKWQQFIFFRQWAALKQYAGSSGVKLYGDLPFYLSYDAAEVWCHADLFSINSDRAMVCVAGVPPDYFNADGQLWGMPVFNWNALKANGYQWWITRIKKNMELYDLLRLDHFRAFSSYWEVPANEQTARNGEWRKGPGKDFMEVLARQFPELPFVAEDLGEISEDVYLLRDQFKLSGMKVLQFAFHKDMAGSEHIPHQFGSANFVVYTGTHDNNTSVGWFEEEATPVEKKNLTLYAGKAASRKNVHTILTSLAYASVAKIAILPMQDVLGLDGSSRMNKPASVGKNWGWSLQKLPAAKIEKRLRKLADFYGRI